MSNSVSEATIKFLVRDEAVSTLLGKGGDTIKHMKEYTGCNVSVSARKEFYPGTSFRVVVIEGNQADVERAVVCMWQLFFSIAKARQNKEKIADLVWTADSNVDMNQYIADKPMEGYLAIPENAGGFIIGKNGSTLEELKRRSGATLFISKQQDSYFSRERTITIQGNTASICCIASIAIVRKLVEGDGTQSYVSYRNRGTRYTIGAILPKDQYTKLPRDDEPVQNDFPVIKKSFEVSNSEVGSVIGENVSI